MITLTSKESQQIEFPGGAPSLPVLGALTVTVETGVAVFAFVGTHAHDWTRDTLSFPVGGPCTAGEFVSGIASAAPASFWTPYSLTPAGSSVGPDVELPSRRPADRRHVGGRRFGLHSAARLRCRCRCGVVLGRCGVRGSPTVAGRLWHIHVAYARLVHGVHRAAQWRRHRRRRSWFDADPSVTCPAAGDCDSS